MQTDLSIDDAVYQEAIAAAAREGVTLREFVEEALRIKLGRTPMKNGETVGEATQPAAVDARSTQQVQETGTVETENEGGQKKREQLAQFFAELNAKPRKDVPSVGPLNREELDQRGTQAELEVPTVTAAEEAEFSKRREDLAEFFTALKVKQATGPSKDEVGRAELLEQFQTLVEQALERDRFKQGRLAPLTREEIYAERLDRFR
jgi:hypothetical protein